ncbi:exopolysaccharide biosynthesis protein [Luteimonas abyssi]|uniref:exopolysaccharide biosynthesis protein n=1 Tax=Luteimonas abyssi TaxID=1247514 RepID=UPI000737D62C|nr:exopolysaccharide biosynthesis protein [Luteimonas abyssi]
MAPEPQREPGDDEEAGIRALLAAYAVGDPHDTLKLRDLLAGLGKRVFGMLLFVAALPAFIPIPGVAGALSGPLTMLVGAQLLIGLRKPWLPRFLAERGPRRDSLIRFERRIAPWLQRLERVVRPRMTGVLDRRPGAMFTGLLLVVLGLLLALPIPFTNFLFGALLLAYALALIERDGAFMLLCWAVGLVAIAVFGVLSGALAAAAADWLGAGAAT